MIRAYRPGIESYVSACGIDHFFVDTALVANAAPLGTFDNGIFQSVGEAQVYWDKQRGWRSPMDPVGVCSVAKAPKCFALARHPGVQRAGLERNHRVSQRRRLPGISSPPRRPRPAIHRITDVNLDLSQKQPYRPEEAIKTLYQNSAHFCEVVRDALREHQRATGRPGVVVAPFDAELFGHWWHEGPTFLRDVIYILSRDRTVKLLTAEQALAQHPPRTVVRLPEGSWGRNGDSSVWLNDQTRPLWEMEYRAESRILSSCAASVAHG